MCLQQGQSLRKMPTRQTQKGTHFLPRSLSFNPTSAYPISCAVRSLHPALRIHTADYRRATWKHTDLLPGDHRVSAATGLGLTAGNCQPQPWGQWTQTTCLIFPKEQRPIGVPQWPTRVAGYVPSPLPKGLSLYLSALPRLSGADSLCIATRFTAHSRALFQSPTCVTRTPSCLTTDSSCSPVTYRKPSQWKDTRDAPWVRDSDICQAQK